MAKGPKKTKGKAIDAALAHAWEHYFDRMVAQLERGEAPERPDIVHGLRSGNPIPQIVRDFIADVLEGKPGFDRRRPRTSKGMKAFQKAWRKFLFEMEILEIEQWEKENKKTYPDKRNEALERAGKRCGVTARTIERALSSRH